MKVKKPAVYDSQSTQCIIGVDATKELKRKRGGGGTAYLKLAEEGYIILGGPLGDGSKTLLIIKSDSEITIQTRLAADPWATISLPKVNRLEQCEILLGKTS